MFTFLSDVAFYLFAAYGVASLRCECNRCSIPSSLPQSCVRQHTDTRIMASGDVIQILEVQLGLVLNSEFNLYSSVTIQHSGFMVPPHSLSYQLSFSP